MKILYGIQGTGHGHISRAKEMLPELSKRASVEVLISGNKRSLGIDREVRFNKRGISLSYDLDGGVSIINTVMDLRPFQLFRDINTISLNKYDLVISDYEPISAWAAKLQGIPSVALSHQAAFLSQKTPRPKRKSSFAESILQYFAPTKSAMGFHFQRYDRFIEPPIIRRPIRELEISDNDHITVYLPAFHHEILKDIFAPFTQFDWHIFTPSCKELVRAGNFRIHPVSNRPFLDSLASCRGVICNAGFETCAEAMYLGKKLLAIPIQNQYEQMCNAAALRRLGIITLTSLDDRSDIWYWLEEQKTTTIEEIADPQEVVQHVLDIGMDKQNDERRTAGSSVRLAG